MPPPQTYETYMYETCMKRVILDRGGEVPLQKFAYMHLLYFPLDHNGPQWPILLVGFNAEENVQQKSLITFSSFSSPIGPHKHKAFGFSLVKAKPGQSLKHLVTPPVAVSWN